MNTNEIIRRLQSYWPKNKAKGILAQSIFESQTAAGSFGETAREKIFPGCWLFSPKEESFYKFRFCFFIHNKVLPDIETKRPASEILGAGFRPFHAIAEFMHSAAIGVVYVLPILDSNTHGLDWQFFTFYNSTFHHTDAKEFFDKWPGNKGRASRGDSWDTVVERELRQLDQQILYKLLLHELFYSDFVKNALHKPCNDPYDVDAFLISLSQRYIFPMEIKEKSPSNNRDPFFGIDAGRVLMLLRLCIPNDANAIYLVREVDQERRFVAWKYVTLSDIIMTAGWNLQAGGTGMGGQSTQTIRIPYSAFTEFNNSVLEESYLQRIGNLPSFIKDRAEEFRHQLETRFFHIP